MARTKIWKADLFTTAEREALLREMEGVCKAFDTKRQQALAHADVKESEYRLLQAVSTAGGATELELAKKMGRSQGQASKGLRKLHNEGWLVMKRGGKTGREQQVKVTEAGRAVFSYCKQEQE